MVPNAPKWYETHQNISLGSNGVDWVRSLRNILMRLRDTKFCTSSDRFAPSFLRQPNCPKCNQMVRNSLKHEFRGSNEVDRVLSLRKIPMRLRGTNFCISSAHFAPSFVRQLTVPNAPQTVRNTPIHEFRVQWGGSGALVAKNSNATSWHKLLH